MAWNGKTLTKKQRQTLKDLAKYRTLEIGSQVHGSVAKALRLKGLAERDRTARYDSIRLTEKGEKFLV